MIFECVKMEHNSVSVLSSFGSHVIMGTRSFVDQLLSFDFNAEISSINIRRRMPRMYNEHVSLYSEETNAENSAGLVVHLYRIVSHILSTRFPTLYMGKRTAIKILLRKRQFSVRFVSCHARILPIKIFFSFEVMSRYTSIRNKKHFDFCSLIRIFAIRLKNVPSNGGDGHPQTKRIFSNLKLFRLKDASIIIPQQYIYYSQKQTEQL